MQAAATFVLRDKSGPIVPKPPKIAPISYFEDRCSRCHGPHGSFYGDDFGKKLNDAALQKVVSDMCRVQGDAALKGTDLDAEVAYHRALIAKEPFLAVTEIRDGYLSGEVTEKAEVLFRCTHAAGKADVKGTTWKVVIPAGQKPTDLIVTAKLGKRTTVLRIAREAFSHAKPTTEPRKAKP